MIDHNQLEQRLNTTLEDYQKSILDRVFYEERNETDWLMEVFAIAPEMKRENRQYWGGKLGRCWEKLVIEVCKERCEGFKEGLKIKKDRPCDLIVGEQAIDTKYRIGSGDSGTLKKFKANAALLKKKGYEPILLIVREDNLPAAITACRSGGWMVLTGDKTFQFLKQLTGFDLKHYLQTKASEYTVQL